ncbi:MAG: hypothetical protein HY369_01445 [Candidatus Aenigmarchaeota archaeon]|nr:hypothetical protein [Candidatus Aenigmarchaeota archaeon]
MLTINGTERALTEGDRLHGACWRQPFSASRETVCAFHVRRGGLVVDVADGSAFAPHLLPGQQVEACMNPDSGSFVMAIQGPVPYKIPSDLRDQLVVDGLPEVVWWAGNFQYRAEQKDGAILMTLLNDERRVPGGSDPWTRTACRYGFGSTLLAAFNKALAATPTEIADIALVRT